MNTFMHHTNTDGDPEFCPNPHCPNHHPEGITRGRWFQRFGFFFSKTRGKTPRFRCKNCGKTCSSQTFSIHYWTHRLIDMSMFDYNINNCSGYRQNGRANEYSYSLLKNRIHRLARNYLNVLDAALSTFSLPENIAFDGFESYLRSQYIPNNFNIAVGVSSRIPYGFTLSLMRRKGTMTETQKHNRSILDRYWRPEPYEITTACKTVFRDILSLFMNRGLQTPLTIFSDKKREYPLALRDLQEYRHLAALALVEHHTISSRATRTGQNPLFPVNYLDRELRKNSAAHTRETVRQDREISMSLSRMTIHIGHHTFIKPFRITNRVKNTVKQSHAEQVHLLDTEEARSAFERLYTHRHVWSRQRMKAKWMEDIWLMKKKNPPIVNFRTGEVKARGQPGNGWVAAHLCA